MENLKDLPKNVLKSVLHPGGDVTRPVGDYRKCGVVHYMVVDSKTLVPQFFAYSPEHLETRGSIGYFTDSSAHTGEYPQLFDKETARFLIGQDAIDRAYAANEESSYIEDTVLALLPIYTGLVLTSNLPTV